MTAAPATRASRPSRAKLDAVAAAATELARVVAEELAGAEAVGAHLEAVADEERVVTHVFACLLPAYRGWRWAVTVARAPRSRQVTVDEAVLLPGPEALLPPAWVPWDQRLRPGDLGVGHLLPGRPDDERLAAGFAPDDEEQDDEEQVESLGPGWAWELGLGRPRVLSAYGREEAATRWHTGTPGPEAPIALAAPGPCGTCGFWLPLAGSLRAAFGVCANEYAPDDGRVVTVDHGCGAHSEVTLSGALADLDLPPAAGPVVDEVGYDEMGAAEPGDDAAASEDDLAELGHS